MLLKWEQHCIVLVSRSQYLDSHYEFMKNTNKNLKHLLIQQNIRHTATASHFPPLCHPRPVHHFPPFSFLRHPDPVHRIPAPCFTRLPSSISTCTPFRGATTAWRRRRRRRRPRSPRPQTQHAPSRHRPGLVGSGESTACVCACVCVRNVCVSE